MSSIVGNFVAYKVIQLMSQSFTDWEAFKTGVIDDKGNVIKKANTSTEKKSWDKFHIIIRNLKRLLAKLPGGSTKIASFAAAMWLIREEFTDKSAEYDKIIMEHFDIDSFYVVLNEEKKNDLLVSGLYEGVYENMIFNIKEDLLPHTRYLGCNIFLVENHVKDIIPVTKELIKLYK